MNLAYQLLKCVFAAHSAKIIHRDIKPSNFLMGDSNLLLCDFGQARVSPHFLSEDKIAAKYTLQVGSRWYKAPELLFGAKQYT